mgnify:FL=1|tara:strand:+ start:19 stop:576 length:558 start_codon:yes stop_codon:yes gene_type:complete
MAKLDQVIHTIELPDGVTHSLDGDTLTLSKDGSQITREFRHSRVSVRDSEGSLEVHCDLPRRREKALSGTWAAHIRNMVKGIDTGFTYRLKAVYSHFPMTIKVQGNEMSITNLFGEKVPRIAPLPWSPTEVKVEVQNKVDVLVSGADIEKVGQTAANIERACRIRKRDRRVFQDGIYIVAKAETE